jgi:hypothetical protein
MLKWEMGAMSIPWLAASRTSERASIPSGSHAMDTSFWRMDFQVDLTGCFDQSRSSLRIQAAHFPQVARKVALSNEIREHSLFQHGSLSVDEIAYRPERLNQMRGLLQMQEQVLLNFPPSR